MNSQNNNTIRRNQPPSGKQATPRLSAALEEQVDVALNPLFLKFSSQYYHYAQQWFNYPRWTIDEAANLFTGCVPFRQMLLAGSAHQQLDDEVLIMENRIRRALGTGLAIIKSKKYFASIYIDSLELMQWAINQSLVIPKDLLRAYRIHLQQTELIGYTTPCLEAVKWVREVFWSKADLREPPTAGEIIQATLQQFPGLNGQECEMIEHICRHPITRTMHPDELI